jgi:hypothetical protein
MLLAILMVEKPALCRFETRQGSMSPISGIRGSIVTPVGGAPRDPSPSPRRAPRTESSRALIPLEPVGSSDTPLRTRPQAGFLAHLIATREKLPQTRERRRAEPQEAIAVYAAAVAGPAAPSGLNLSRRA